MGSSTVQMSVLSKLDKYINEIASKYVTWDVYNETFIGYTLARSGFISRDEALDYAKTLDGNVKIVQTIKRSN